MCTEDYGDCELVHYYLVSEVLFTYASHSDRCDNCKGSFQDISTQMDE